MRRFCIRFRDVYDTKHIFTAQLFTNPSRKKCLVSHELVAAWQKIFPVNLVADAEKEENELRIPKSTINNSLCESSRVAESARHTNRENFVQVNVSQKEFLCHSLAGC